MRRGLVTLSNRTLENRSPSQSLTSPPSPYSSPARQAPPLAALRQQQAQVHLDLLLLLEASDQPVESSPCNHRLFVEQLQPKPHLDLSLLVSRPGMLGEAMGGLRRVNCLDPNCGKLCSLAHDC